MIILHWIRRFTFARLFAQLFRPIFTPIFAPIFAALLIIGLVIFALEVVHSHKSTQQKLTVRKLELTTLSPPPAPPQIQKAQPLQDSAPNLQLDIDGAGAVMQFTQTALLQDIKVAELPEVEVENMQAAMLDSINLDWHALGLSELDEIPHLLTKLKVSFPNSLKRKGVSLVEVKLDVLIDENGNVLLKNVLHNPYPELTKAIKSSVRKARFSIPKKDGVAVRTSFHWPLEFADS